MSTTEVMTISPADGRKIVEGMNIPADVKAKLLVECDMREELQREILQLGERIAKGEEVSWDAMSEIFERVATKYGYEGGLPLPHIDDEGTDKSHPLVMARNSPLAMIANANYATEAAAEYERSWKRHVRNSWDVLGDHSVLVVETSKGSMWVKEPRAGIRLRKLMADVSIRNDIHTMTAEAELKAMESLKARVTGNQYRAYVLSGAFFERSPRTDLFYLFRKGFPTLVLSYHGEKNEGGRVIVALCFHPMGFYQFSHVGVMCPTDEVVAALLMMRGHEAKFWSKSGQWPVTDSRSGV